MADIGKISLVVQAEFQDLTKLAKTSKQVKTVLLAAAKEFARTNDLSKYMKAVNAVVRAEDKLTQSSVSSRSAIMKLGAKVVQETKFTDQLTLATKRLSTAQVTSGKVMQQTKNKMNGNNMAIQQLGYQFGDFAVQVQGGTSAFTAFSQQGAQLAGILPMIAGPLGLTMGAAVGLSAALGILIPVGSALGRFFYEMSTGAEKAKDALSRFSDALSTVKANVEISRTSLVELRKEYGASAEAVKRLSALVLQASVDKAMVAMGDAVDPFSKKLSEATDKIILARAEIKKRGEDSPFAEGFAKEITDASEALGILPDDIVALGKAFDDVTSSIELPDIAEAAEAALNLIDNIDFTGKKPDEITKAVLELNKVLIASSRAVSSLGTAFEAPDAAASNLQDTLENLGKRSNEWTRSQSAGYAVSQAIAVKNRENFKVLLADMKAENELLGLKVFYAGNAAGLKREEAELARKAFRAEQVALKLHPEKIKLLMAEYDNRVAITNMILDAVEATKLQAKALREAEAYSKNFARFGEGIETSIVKATAAIKALEEGSNVANATMIAGLKHELGLRHEIALATAEGAEAKKAQMDAYIAALERIEVLAKLLKQKGDLTPSSKSSNKSNVIDFAAMVKEAEHKRDLIGLTKEEARFKVLLFNLTKSNATKEDKVRQEELVRQANKIHAINEETVVLKEAADQQEALANMVGNSMETAMMGIVDGTMSVKEAFKSMASEIIKELYRVLVVQEMVASAKLAMEAKGGFLKMLGGFFGGASANGNVFSEGAQVQAYANGGVVNGPTNFPMAGNKVGLMGEAGPEAIMPLKRGANGKLGVQAEGGGGDVINISQSFNFQANGDDSVKKLIAQAAPRIAELAKASVIESRRRGGSTKAAFN